jgi:hypothetical protein
MSSQIASKGTVSKTTISYCHESIDHVDCRTHDRLPSNPRHHRPCPYLHPCYLPVVAIVTFRAKVVIVVAVGTTIILLLVPQWIVHIDSRACIVLQVCVQVQVHVCKDKSSQVKSSQVISIQHAIDKEPCYDTISTIVLSSY